MLCSPTRASVTGAWSYEIVLTGSTLKPTELGTQAPLLAYFGHHKAASTWLGDITREMSTSAGLRYAGVHSPRKFGGDLAGFVSSSRVEFLAYVNANHRHVSSLRNFRAFHVIRDPRDIVVSSYFSHLHSHPTDDWPELVGHRAELQRVDKEQGIYLVMDFIQDVLDDIATWDYTSDRILELKMEEVVRAPLDALVRAFTFVGLVDPDMPLPQRGVVKAMTTINRKVARVALRTGQLPVSVAAGTIRRNAFAAKSDGRARGVEDVSNHYRKGVPGDWVNHLGPGHRRRFKQGYGELLIQLGYESSMDW